MLRIKQYLFGTLAFLLISFGAFLVLPMDDRYPNSVDSSTGIDLQLFSNDPTDKQAALALAAIVILVGIVFAVLAWRNGAAADHIKKHGDPTKAYFSANDG